MTQPLSPAAQAIWDAYQHVDCDPYRVDPRQAGLAAALSAVADQVVPAETAPKLMRGPDLERLAQRQQTRAEILAIAAELRQ